MKTVTFQQACTVYPDGETPMHVEKGAEAPFDDAYADLLVGKDHAVLSPTAAPAPFRLDIAPPATPAAV